MLYKFLSLNAVRIPYYDKNSNFIPSIFNCAILIPIFKKNCQFVILTIQFDDVAINCLSLFQLIFFRLRIISLVINLCDQNYGLVKNSELRYQICQLKMDSQNYGFTKTRNQNWILEVKPQVWSFWYSACEDVGHVIGAWHDFVSLI